MFYTVTFCPALDHIMEVEKLSFDDINRAKETKSYYGGKGINASAVFSRLGGETTALGFLAGHNGRKIKGILDSEGVNSDFIFLEKGETRINIKIKTGKDLKKELIINAPGTEVSENDIEELCKKLDEAKQGDFILLAGSIPKNTPDDIYLSIMKRLSGRGINFIVDAEGDLLKKALEYKPFLIKPNHHELGNMFDVEINTKELAVENARKLQKMGARNVLVSMAADGAILVDENGKTYDAPKTTGNFVNSTGCGDSMIAGFVFGYLKTGDYYEALKWGTACGSATAFTERLGDIEGIKEQMNSIENQ